jgi:hypothetical protein
VDAPEGRCGIRPEQRDRLQKAPRSANKLCPLFR